MPSLFTVAVNRGLRREHFVLSAHRAIFNAMGRIVQRGDGLTLPAIVSELERQGLADTVGNAAYVAGLCDGVVAVPSSLEHDIEALMERKGLREFSRVAAQLAEQACQPEACLAEVMGAAKKAVLQLEVVNARRNGHRSEAVPLPDLIDKLETYFGERAHLPEGGALALAHFALNTWTYDLFDTTPFLSVESAVPGCGKTTVLSLLRVCRRSVSATALTEATLFRVISEQRPTLLIDEAEFLEGKSDRAQMIRSIANAGYKRGAQVPRCGSAEANYGIEWYEVYASIVFAVIGGLSGTLLERCIVLHMDKKPRGLQLKRCRERVLERDAKSLRDACEAYALQARERLIETYEHEPDQGYWPAISDREAEIWGPLLTHARLAGPMAEARLLAACASLTRQKADIQSEEWNSALGAELRSALEKFSGDRFRPVDLIDSLSAAETWGTTLAKYRPDDAKSRASAVGRFIQQFRLKSRQRGEAGTSYLRSEALEVLSLLTADNSASPASLPVEVSDAAKQDTVARQPEKTPTASPSASLSASSATSQLEMALDDPADRLADLADISGGDGDICPQPDRRGDSTEPEPDPEVIL